MTPREYEIAVAHYYTKQGYNACVTPFSQDYGVDVIATKGEKKLAIQAKMFGKNRPINRPMVMEFHGSRCYFDCIEAVIVTDGAVRADAREVAKKLNIQILHLTPEELNQSMNGFPKDEPKPEGSVEPKSDHFESIWQKHIMPLQGQVISRPNGDSNKIVKVDWAGIERISSKGGQGKIPIEIFRETVNHILKHGHITRDEINQQYAGRASSGIILILSTVPRFEWLQKPSRLVLIKDTAGAPRH